MIINDNYWQYMNVWHMCTIMMFDDLQTWIYSNIMKGSEAKGLLFLFRNNISLWIFITNDYVWERKKMLHIWWLNVTNQSLLNYHTVVTSTYYHLHDHYNHLGMYMALHVIETFKANTYASYDYILKLQDSKSTESTVNFSIQQRVQLISAFNR